MMFMLPIVDFTVREITEIWLENGKCKKFLNLWNPQNWNPAFQTLMLPIHLQTAVDDVKL